MHVTISGALPYAPVSAAVVRWRRGGELRLSDDQMLLVLPDKILLGRVEHHAGKSLQILEELVLLTEVSSISFEYGPVPNDVWNRLSPQYSPHPPLYYEMEAELGPTDPYQKGKPDLN